ncbi:Yip1 domain-containing protein [Trichoderma barbatum]
MSQYYNQYGASASPSATENLQFYHGSYQATPSQAPPASYGVPPPGGGFREQSGLRTGWLAAFSAEGYDNEPSLREELGVDFGHVQAKTLAVLNPFSPIERLEHVMNDSDLAGPLLFVVLFGAFLLCSGSVHFGYVYGLALMGSTALYMILSLMTPDTPPGYPGADVAPSTLTFTQNASVLGYSFLPLVLTSLIGVAMPLDCTAGYIITSLAICWSTSRSSAIFCAVGKMRDMRGLVAYPVALFYVGFGIITIFNSRGKAQ